MTTAPPFRSRVLTAAAIALWAGSGLGLSACAPKPPQLSIQDVMDKKVDPSADALWDVVGSTITETGVVHRRPTNPVEWAEARTYATSLIEGSKLLQIGRPVGRDGHSALADASTPGTRTAVQVSADIKTDPTRFYALAAGLQRTGETALAAIDREDVEGLVLAGGEIDQACENCHAAYWYPRNPYKPFPGAEEFGKIATRP